MADVDLSNAHLRPLRHRQIEAARRLDELFPEQREPWVLFDPDGDPIAYLNVYELAELGPIEDIGRSVPAGSVIQADLSGRHSPHGLVGAMAALRSYLGGLVLDDDGQPMSLYTPLP